MKGVVIDLKDITDSREVMESKESPGIRIFIYIVTAVVVLAVLFSCFFEIDEYSKVSGEIKTLSAAGAVVPCSSCKLSEIKVSEGQRVKKDDVLFTLDSDYALQQKKTLEDKLADYNSDLSNTKLLKQSVDEDKNLFKNDSADSEFYYRYEQYKNGVLLSGKEIDNSQLSNSLSDQDKENSLETAKKSISQKQKKLNEYKNVIAGVESDADYSSCDKEINSGISQYKTSYEKAVILRDSYKSAYDQIQQKYENRSDSKISSAQTEQARQKSDSAYSALTSYQTSFLSDVRSKIVLLENQLVSDSSNENARNTLNIYKDLKNALDNNLEFCTFDEDIQSDYNNYCSKCDELLAIYNQAQSEYNSMYEEFTGQDTAEVTQTDVDSARCSYESAELDVQNIKNTYLAQLQAAVSSLNDEINTLENNKKSIELSLAGSDDLKEYEKLSGDKLKNEAVVSLNSEIDSINDNILSVKAQISEVDETLKNSEIKAQFDGTVTLMGELSSGDIVEGGKSLCTLIPDTDQLKAMLYIPENEVSKIKKGQKTEYIFDSIPYNEYGKVTGEITSISADSISNQSTGGKYFIAQADISAVSLTNRNGETRDIKTGMMVQAKTISGSKKAIVWMLEKINFIE